MFCPAVLQENAIEKHVIETKQEFKEQEQKEWITHVQNLAKQDIFYYNFRKSESEIVHMPDDIWEQLPQSFPDEGRDLARQLMNHSAVSWRMGIFRLTITELKMQSARL